jgi:ribosomal protein S21
MVEIKVDPNKPFEAALRQFKKKVELSGITGEMRGNTMRSPAFVAS